MSNSAFTPTFAQNLQDASATQNGLVNTTTQVFAGVKTFNNGINLGGTNLTAYEEGTWTPSIGGSNNLNGTGTATIGAATYTRVGNTVFARIENIAGLSVITAGGTTYVVLNSTGLPGVTNTTQFYGGATIWTTTGVYGLAAGISDNINTTTQLVLVIGAFSGVGVSNGSALTVNSIHFSYKV